MGAEEADEVGRCFGLECMPAGEAVVEDDGALSDSLPETPIEKVVNQPTRGT
jgi:hypothetical protein